MADYLDISGNSGPYRYWFLHGPAKSQPGNYMFLKPTTHGWVPVYIGIADDLNARLSNHDMWLEARYCGATHMAGHIQTDARLRKSEEQDLIQFWNPVCNTQHRTAAPLETFFGRLG